MTGKNVIVGGGGLIHKSFTKSILKTMLARPRTFTVWGIGHNYGPAALRKELELFPSWLDQCDFVGVRDWIPEKQHWYLPCASCMHPAFDMKFGNIHDVVIFSHAAKTGALPPSLQHLPHMNNNQRDMFEVIRFLANSNTILTNSYHGAYWGLLLGKQVIVTAWSIKFNYFRYPPTVVTDMSNWHQAPLMPLAPPDYLAECKSLNRDFYNRFMDRVASSYPRRTYWRMCAQA